MTNDKLLKIYLNILINETKKLKKIKLNAKYGKYATIYKKIGD